MTLKQLKIQYLGTNDSKPTDWFLTKFHCFERDKKRPNPFKIQAPNLLMICTHAQIKLIELLLEILQLEREHSHPSNPFKSFWNPFWEALKRFSCLRSEHNYLKLLKDTHISPKFRSPVPRTSYNTLLWIQCLFDIGLSCFILAKLLAS
jgi:hypothetical protein